MSTFFNSLSGGSGGGGPTVTTINNESTVFLKGSGADVGDVKMHVAGTKIYISRYESWGWEVVMDLTNSATTDKFIVKTAGDDFSRPTDAIIYIAEAIAREGKHFERNLIRNAFSDGAIVVGSDVDNIFFTPPTVDGLMVSIKDGAEINISTLVTISDPISEAHTIHGVTYWDYHVNNVRLNQTHKVNSITMTVSGVSGDAYFRILQTRGGKIESESSSLASFLNTRSGAESKLINGVNEIVYWFDDFLIAGQESDIRIQVSQNITITDIDMRLQPKAIEHLTTRESVAGDIGALEFLVFNELHPGGNTIHDRSGASQSTRAGFQISWEF